MMETLRNLLRRENFVQWHATEHLVAELGENLTESFLVGALEFLEKQLGVFIDEVVQLWSYKRRRRQVKY